MPYMMSPPLQSRPRSFVHAHQEESLSASEYVGSLAVREEIGIVMYALRIVPSYHRWTTKIVTLQR
jgi:hypothetical protein